jgi:predicted nucleic acid-binding protein
MFWDSSSVVPLLLPDNRSAALATLLRSDTEPALWWASPVEYQSALYRRHREGGLPSAALAQALERLKALVADVDVVAPTPPLRERASRLLAGHPLRPADALQLAAALVWCDESPQGDAFVCLDERLADAARREGFSVLPD